MATKWVYRALFKPSALVKSSALLKPSALVFTGLLVHAVTAHAQETTDGVPAESAAAPTEALTSVAPASETAATPSATGELASSAASETPPPSAVPAPQTGGFVQRLSDRLNGVNHTPPSPAPVPEANRDPRADLLDTSFPAEQPEQADEPSAFVPFNSRRTQARTANGITELSNRPEFPATDAVPALNRAATPKASLSRPQVNTEISTPRLDSQVSLPSTSIPRATSSMSPWLWVLAGTAALLLVPIAFLLTRPTR